MKTKDHKDVDPSYDYLANNLFVQEHYSREITAEQMMEAQYLENGPLFKYHPDAAQILENISIALMGTIWCNEWLAKNIHNNTREVSEQGFCECETPEFVPYIECNRCGKPPLVEDVQDKPLHDTNGRQIKEIQHTLRNPWGKSDEQMMKARHGAADQFDNLTARIKELERILEGVAIFPDTRKYISE